jgi:hypothetical protein
MRVAVPVDEEGVVPPVRPGMEQAALPVLAEPERGAGVPEVVEVPVDAGDRTRVVGDDVPHGGDLSDFGPARVVDP